MEYLLLLSAIAVFGAQTLFFKIFSRGYMKNLASYFAFCFCYFAVVVVSLAAFGIQLAGIHTITIALAVLFGFTFVASIYSYMKAMENGPLSLSSLTFSMGLLIPILFGAIFWREPVSLLQGAALLLLFFTFYLGGDSREAAVKKINGKWMAYCAGGLIGNGSLMTLVKAHQMQLPGLETKEFLVLAFGTAALLALLLFLWRRFRIGEKVPHLKTWSFALLALGTGITTAIGNQVTVVLSGMIPAVIQFPVANGGVVFFSSLLSVVVFREKMKRKAWVGLALGLVALVLISLR